MKTIVLVLLNVSLIGAFFILLRKTNLLYYSQGGRIWLTWLAVAVITLMDELTSVFYAPAEAYRFIGPSAIFFIAFTAVFIHYMTTRLVEIAEILEFHGIFGGGVYSFSYLVLGPVVSFVAVASIMVDYILTACISAVSAVENATSFFAFSHSFKMMTAITIVWAIAGLNIIGIKENARFTFSVFIFATIIFLNLIVSGFLSMDGESLTRLEQAVEHAGHRMNTGSIFSGYGIFIASVASCVLAYSGVESVLQTAGLVRTWREIGRAYIFLAVTVGVVTPVVAALALSAPIDFRAHEGDLITHYATMINGVPFGVAVAILASLTLIMAINTAFVASSELLERVAERYGFSWLITPNRNDSLYRIHLINAAFFSVIILITRGSQMILADMYALGLIASFCINMGSLIIYRYFMGTKEIKPFSTNRFVTVVFLVVFLSCFFFLAWMKPHGTELWATITGIVLLAGLMIAKRRAPEIKAAEQSDSQMDMILHLSESVDPEVHIYFRRPREEAIKQVRQNEAYVTYFNPRRGAPNRLSSNHFRFVAERRSVYQHMVDLLKVVEYELTGRSVVVHFGWPMSSWLDRISIGVMVFNVMRLPKQFPRFKFEIYYPGQVYKGTN
ncbi:APC family permease [Desulfomonile tiedjei]|uniref:Amino acid/polyamine/organocation transporter, APC superfamily n=1 Tax=Desulfomonile tiedjei (strain ATCC 49306 / DSM 6799 / DCB-1) TaxID=706587 RepID=I4C0M8_DESTA|nr:amino acid permease [Desulfomonile tiedjei]AFM23119.1 amino acid/polyamine/organocation transporter, APC superfamily [Desulfomonile tiedjei DSM 6799]